jgi:hypothetical protein
MTKPYKLSSEIKEFIIREKKSDPKLSCRGLISRVKEHFQVALSKSLINNIIKEHNLSAPVGRRRIRSPIAFSGPIEEKIEQKSEAFVENGGLFFLKAANLKLNLTHKLAQNLLAYFPGLSEENLQGIIEACIYLPYFKDKNSLCLFIGRKISKSAMAQYSKKLAEIPIGEINKLLMRLGFLYNINEINELHKECLIKINNYAQADFFPAVYQTLDFAAMQERFYSLLAKVEKRPKLLKIQLFYPTHFTWLNDLVWQEDIFYAANKLNKSEIFSQDNEQFWMSPRLKIKDEKAVSFL